MATAVLPALLLSLGAGPGWLGAIEGLADGLSGATKLAAGHWTDRLHRRKPLVVSAYAITAAATGSLAFAASAFQVMSARCAAWLARGVRTPARKAMLAAAVPSEAYGRAFGFERMMDTLGAVLAPATALWLLGATGHNYRRVFLWTLLPGMLAAAMFGVLVRERPVQASSSTSFVAGLRNLPVKFRWFLVAVGVFGLGDFSHTMLILYATRALATRIGFAAASSLAIGLYLLHNVFYSAFAYVGGWLSDHAPHRRQVRLPSDMPRLSQAWPCCSSPVWPMESPLPPSSAACTAFSWASTKRLRIPWLPNWCRRSSTAWRSARWPR